MFYTSTIGIINLKFNLIEFIKKCANNPCQNNGQCLNTFGTYACVCPIGFAGKDCSTAVTDPCQYNTCDDEGSAACRPTENDFGYTCECKPSYGGINCNTLIPPCLSNPCQNNATCVESKIRVTQINSKLK